MGGRFAKQNGEQGTPEPETSGASRQAFSRSRERKKFAQELPEIMKALTDQAKTGSVAHLKALVELTGLGKSKPPRTAGKRRGKSLEAILREQWRKDEEDAAAQAQPEPPGDEQNASQPSGGDSDDG